MEKKFTSIGTGTKKTHIPNFQPVRPSTKKNTKESKKEDEKLDQEG